MYEIDFSEPQWLLYYYYIIGSISLVLNSFSIYLLLFNSNQLNSFKYYLLVFQLFCILTDIHLTFLVQPVTLLPFIAGYTVGILSTWFDISANACIVTTGFIALIQLESLMVCFYKKHQAIAIILKRHVLPDVILYICYFLCVISPLSFCGFINYLNLDREQSFVFIKQNYPEHYENFSKLSHFALYESSPVQFVVSVMTIFGGLLFFVLLFLFSIDIFLMMASLKQKISKSTYEKHQDALRSLMVQFVIAMMCLAPPIFFTIVVIFETPHVNVVGDIFVAWFVSNSSIYTISLFIFFPPYRKLFVKFLKRKSAKVSFISPLVVL